MPTINQLVRKGRKSKETNLSLQHLTKAITASKKHKLTCHLHKNVVFVLVLVQ